MANMNLLIQQLEAIYGGTIYVAGDWDGDEDDAFTPTGGTVVFDGTNIQYLEFNSNSNLENIIINNSTYRIHFTKDTLYVNNDFTVSSGCHFSQYDGLVQVNGDFLVDGSNNSQYTYPASYYHLVLTPIGDSSILDLNGNVTVTSTWWHKYCCKRKWSN